jgi:hypothetical protein
LTAGLGASARPIVQGGGAVDRLTIKVGSKIARPVVLYRLPSGDHDWPAIESDIITGMATSR